MSEAATTWASASEGLLAPNEPGPVERHNADGHAPLLLLCDHASAFIPRALGRLGLDEAQLCRHITLDIGAAAVTRAMAERLDAPAVLSGFSRLIIDPNRTLEAPSLIPQTSDGVAIPGNRKLSKLAIEARRKGFYQPYHDAVARQIETMRAATSADVRTQGPAVVSVHSFTPVMNGAERPWQIGILWNRDPRFPQAMIAKLRALGLVVGNNQPYSGRDKHGHSLFVHGDSRGLPNLLIELRQDLIDTHGGAEDWAALLSDRLAELIKDPELFESSDR